jgi:hypothetical protein
MEILSPGMELSTLAPRLIEFGEIVLDDGTLIPVQSPFEQKWYRLSYSRLLEDIINRVNVSVLEWINI